MLRGSDCCPRVEAGDNFSCWFNGSKERKSCINTKLDKLLWWNTKHLALPGWERKSSAFFGQKVAEALYCSCQVNTHQRLSIWDGSKLSFLNWCFCQKEKSMMKLLANTQNIKKQATNNWVGGLILLTFS